MFDSGEESDVALITPTKAVRYGELRETAEKIGGCVDRRSLVFLEASNCPEAIMGYVGFLHGDAVVMMLNAGLAQGAYAQLEEQYRPEYLWCPCGRHDEGNEELFRLQGYHLLRTPYWNDEDPHPDLSLLLTTSGSTGSRKYVRLSRENIESNAGAIIASLNITADDRPVTTLPPSYSYGLSIINSHLAAGAAVVLSDYSLFDRKMWDLVREKGATTFGGVPYTFAMLEKLHFDRMDLPSLRYLTQAGGKLGNRLHEKFARICSEKGIGFIVMYGQTEATARLSYLPAHLASEKIGSVGVPIPGGRFSLMDGSGAAIGEPGVAGELVYEGGNVGMGYAEGRADLSLGDAWGGKLHTGDIAKRDADGCYYIVGRKRRFLKVFGNRVNLEEIEGMLDESGFVAACAGEDDDIAVFVEEGDPSQVQAFLSEATGLARSAFRIVHVEKLPRNDAGKVLYSQLGGAQ